MIDLYFRGLKSTLHWATGVQLTQEDCLSRLDEDDLAALCIYTFADLPWDLDTRDKRIHWHRKSPKRSGIVDGGSRRSMVGLHSPENVCDGDLISKVVFLEPDHGTLPWCTIRNDLGYLFRCVETDLTAENIHWHGPPHFQHCEDGRELLERIKVKKLDPAEVLADLEPQRRQHLNELATARRGAERRLQAETEIALPSDSRITENEPTSAVDVRAEPGGDHHTKNSDASGTRRAKRAVPKEVEMKGRASTVEEAINRQIEHDTGESLATILREAGVLKETFYNSAHFQGARLAWETLNSRRNPTREAFKSDRKSDRRKNRKPL